jgi:hypothetical protein
VLYFVNMTHIFQNFRISFFNGLITPLRVRVFLWVRRSLHPCAPSIVIKFCIPETYSCGVARSRSASTAFSVIDPPSELFIMIESSSSSSSSSSCSPPKMLV